MIEIRPARLGDAAYVGRNLRVEDEREVWAATGRSPSRVLVESFRLSSECYAVFRVGSPVPCAVFGAADDPSVSGLGVVWMLCTAEVAKCAKSLVQTAPEWLDRMTVNYPLGMHNLAHSMNHLHVRWCRLSGFHELGRLVIRGEEFIHIHRESNV